MQSGENIENHYLNLLLVDNEKLYNTRYDQGKFTIGGNLNSQIFVVGLVGWFMVFNATFNNISFTSYAWWSVLFVEDTEVHEENHQSVCGNNLHR